MCWIQTNEQVIDWSLVILFPTLCIIKKRCKNIPIKKYPFSPVQSSSGINIHNWQKFQPYQFLTNMYFLIVWPCSCSFPFRELTKYRSDLSTLGKFLLSHFSQKINSKFLIINVQNPYVPSPKYKSALPSAGGRAAPSRLRCPELRTSQDARILISIFYYLSIYYELYITQINHYSNV